MTWQIIFWSNFIKYRRVNDKSKKFIDNLSDLIDEIFMRMYVRARPMKNYYIFIIASQLHVKYTELSRLQHYT